MGKDNTVEFITPPNDLRDKVGQSAQVSVEPDYDALDDIVVELGKEFVKRLPGELNAIAEDLNKLKADPENTALSAVLFRRVHDLKGQAGTYDYWLITVVGNDLCRFIEHAKPITPVHLQVMDYHVQAMVRVMDQKMTGKEPAGGKKLVDTLHEMAGKVLKDRPSS